MPDKFMENTIEGMKEANDSREMRNLMDDVVCRDALGKLSNIAESENLSDNQKWQYLYAVAASGVTFRVILKRLGEQNLKFPEEPFNEACLRWIARRNPARPVYSYLEVMRTIRAGDYVLTNPDFEVLPPKAEATERYRVSKSPHLQELLKEMASTFSSDESLVIPEPHESEQQLLDAFEKNLTWLLYQEPVGKEPKAYKILGAEDSRQIAHVGLVEGLKKKLKEPAREIIHSYFTYGFDKYIKSAMRWAIRGAIRKELRKPTEGTIAWMPQMGETTKLFPIHHLDLSERCIEWGLTERETEVALLISFYIKEKPKKRDIANALGISPPMITKYLKSIGRKYNIWRQKQNLPPIG